MSCTNRARPEVTRPSSSRTMTAPGGDRRIVASSSSFGAASRRHSRVPVSVQRYRHALVSDPASAAGWVVRVRSHTQPCHRAQLSMAAASHSAT